MPLVFLKPIDNPRDSVFDSVDVEVDEQAKTLIRQFEISEQLFLMHWRDLLDRFHLDDYLTAHDQVGAKSGIEPHLIVNHWNRLLAYDLKPSSAQLKRQRCYVDGFQQAWTESCMNPKRRVDNFGSNGILDRFRCLSFSLRSLRLCAK
jgi:hypothetical protein